MINRSIVIVTLAGALFFLTACSEQSNASHAVMPLYASCSELLPRYEQKLDRLGYDARFVQEEFSSGPAPSLPGLLGVLRLEGDLNQQEAIEIQNGLKVLCFPGTLVRTDASPTELSYILSAMRENRTMENYLIYDGEYLTLYQNGSSAEQRKEVLEIPNLEIE